MFFDKFIKKEKALDLFKEEYVSKKEFNELKKLADTQQRYLNNIYIFYELKPTPFLKSLRDLSYELIEFVDNVCKKHEIEYWMDYGTLLGSVRHNGFVPWDDDLDVGMMRSDYNRLIPILQNEVEENDLRYLVPDFKIDKHNDKSKRWYQLSYKDPNFKGKFIGVDFFPYDYIKEYNKKDIDERYNNALTEYYHNPDDFTLEEYMDKFYDEFNLTLDKTDNVISGIDNARGDIRKYTAYRTFLLKTDDIFPLKRMQFGEHYLPAPKNTTKYIKDIYGKKYFEIPNKIRDHGRFNRYVKKANIMEALDEGIQMLKKANDNFK
ncbi:LicD family protein [Methanobrevibacter sp.]|uniref:LicD family protein n=1 Tax=Methanobrevibacter sp. TaxID=66852 RepID=UPI00388F370C